MTKINSIWVGVDFSETSDRALEYAASLASTLNARMTLVHVYSLAAYALPLEGTMITPPTYAAELSNHLQAELDARVNKLKQRDLPVQGKLLMGVPYTELPKAAKENGADLIVVGTHGRTGVAHMLMGSVAERVVRLSELPVLTVH